MEIVAGQPGRFVTGSTMRHVVEMTVSGSIGLLFMFLVDALSLWWVSQLGQEQLVAALGFAWTIQFAAVSVAIGLMIGTVALVSRALGAGRRAEARRIAASTLLIAVVIQAAVGLAAWVFRDDLLYLTNARGETLRVASDFLNVSLPSLPAMATAMVATGILRAAGDAWLAMLVAASAGFVAIFLDPFLIVYAGLGVDGAAIALFCSRLVSAIVGLFILIRVRDLLAPPRRGDVVGLLGPFFAVAAPAIATQLATPFGNWIIAREIGAFGDSAAAGWSVVSRLTILTFGGIYALSGAVGGIFGQNYGAGRLDRVRQTYLDGLVFCGVYTLAAWALLAALQGPIITGFGLSDEGADVVWAFNCIAAGAFVFVGSLFVSNAAFNNLGRPMWSLWVNWLRDGVLLLPLAMLLAGVLAAPGVIYAQGIAAIAVGIVSTWLGWRFVNGLEAPRAAPIFDTKQEV